MIYEYMIPIYAYLIKAKSRTLESIPEKYRIVVAEHLVAEEENKTQ